MIIICVDINSSEVILMLIRIIRMGKSNQHIKLISVCYPRTLRIKPQLNFIFLIVRIMQFNLTGQSINRNCIADKIIATDNVGTVLCS